MVVVATVTFTLDQSPGDIEGGSRGIEKGDRERERERERKSKPGPKGLSDQIEGEWGRGVGRLISDTGRVRSTFCSDTLR